MESYFLDIPLIWLTSQAMWCDMWGFLNILIYFWGTRCSKVPWTNVVGPMAMWGAAGLGCLLYTWIVWMECFRLFVEWRKGGVTFKEGEMMMSNFRGIPAVWRQPRLGDLEEKNHNFCEQMVWGECMLRDSADARERMSINNSISASITLFTISLILSHNYWFVCVFLQGDHVLVRALLYLCLGKSLYIIGALSMQVQWMNL